MFFSGAGQVPIDRSSGSAAQAAIQTGLRILREGKLLGIYPEGTRSPDGRLYRGKTGVARMALETRRPGHPGRDDQHRRDAADRQEDRRGSAGSGSASARRWTSPATRGWPGDRFVERAITDEIMYELMQLSGQEYVDVYAAKVKAQAAAGGKIGLPDAAELTDVARPARAPTEKAS